jgi:DNA processing protein
MKVQTKLDLLTLALLPGLTPREMRDLRVDGPLERVLTHPDRFARSRDDKTKGLLSARAVSDLESGAAREEARVQCRRAEAKGLGVVALGEADYPERLAEIYDPPPVLFVRGRLSPGEGARAVAIVGSRAATPTGLAFARALARDLAEAGLTIVSGLARGIDTAAHQGALEGGGRTVAVLGSGLERLYPAENAPLAEEIVASGGALVSEFGLDTGPWKVNFPRRNRVIAGWGRGVVVVEATLKSGALITARLANDEGREVMAVPGHPTVAAAAGTNRLLRKGEAAVVRDADDVLHELEMERAEPVEDSRQEDDVLEALRRDTPSSLEDIARRSGRDLAEVLPRLGELELAARVRRLPGSLFVRS